MTQWHFLIRFLIKIRIYPQIKNERQKKQNVATIRHQWYMLFHHFNNCDNATITLFTDHYLIFIYSTEDGGGPKQPTKDIHEFSIIDNCVKTKADPIPPTAHFILLSLAHKNWRLKKIMQMFTEKNKNPTLIQSEIRSKKRVVFNIRQASGLGGSSKWLTTRTSTFYITVSPEKQTTKLVQRKKRWATSWDGAATRHKETEIWYENECNKS